MGETATQPMVKLASRSSTCKTVKPPTPGLCCSGACAWDGRPWPDRRPKEDGGHPAIQAITRFQPSTPIVKHAKPPPTPVIRPSGTLQKRPFKSIGQPPTLESVFSSVSHSVLPILPMALAVTTINDPCEGRPIRCDTRPSHARWHAWVSVHSSPDEHCSGRQAVSQPMVPHHLNKHPGIVVRD